MKVQQILISVFLLTQFFSTTVSAMFNEPWFRMTSPKYFGIKPRDPSLSQTSVERLATLPQLIKENAIDDIKRLAREQPEEFYAALNRCDTSKLAPIHYAIQSGNSELIKFLIDSKRADLRLENFTKGSTALHYAAACDSSEIVELLINSVSEQYGDDEKFKYVNHIASHNKTPLYYAITNSRPDNVACLLRYGARLNIPDENDSPSLNLAIAIYKSKNITPEKLHDQMTVIKLLVHYIVNIYHKNIDDDKDVFEPRDTAVHIAARLGHNDVIEYLAANGASVDIPNDYEEAPLFYAVLNGQFDTVKYLIENFHANPLKKNIDDQTPLKALIDDIELIRHQADPAFLRKLEEIKEYLQQFEEA